MSTANATIPPEWGTSAFDLQAWLQGLYSEIGTAVAQVQSPYLYLQAAGSDGSDGSTRGIQLRWDLLRSLGDHLPKGDLAFGPSAPYPAAYGFNKADDFVGILCVPYIKTYPCVVNFTTDKPAVVETGAQRLWKFDTTVGSTNPPQHREVVVRFNDIAQYDAIRATNDPVTSPFDFLWYYTGVVETEVTNQLCFAMSVTTLRSEKGSEATLRVESISVAENVADADLFISCRRRFFPTDAPEGCLGSFVSWLGSSPDQVLASICAENIRYFRFDFGACAPRELRLETYEQFIIGSILDKYSMCNPIGHRFALSDQDAVVFDRLNPQYFPTADGKWPRFVGADPVTGLFTANYQNYRAKWNPTLPPTNESTDDNGLKKGVIGYLSRSMNPANPKAIDSLSANDPNDSGSFDISYLQMLRLVALDFHVACMLGLGQIDKRTVHDEATKYVHLAVYRTTAALEPGEAAAAKTHLYMTLPTSQFDFRLPPAPVQNVPTFGLSVDTGTDTPIQLTDTNGYVPFDDARMINLHIEPYDTVQPFGPFFQPPVEFCSCDVTKPVFYGFKYKLLSEAAYRIPEVSNDEEFNDSSGAPEVVPLLPQVSAIPNAPNPPIYTHEERETGLHRYAFYCANWFLRPSSLGNPQDVDTQFPKRNSLLPPANLAVQLIQFEDPLILTTAPEQQELSALNPGDATLVRCTFDWNQNHYIPQRFSTTNAYADKVQFYFRQDPPQAVQGEIKSVTSLSSTVAEVHTQPYTITSASPAQTMTPAIVSGDELRFVGSSFAANQVLYIVDSVSQPAVAGEGAVFRIRKQSQTSVVDLNNNNQFAATLQTAMPSAGDRFLAVENMNETVNWGANLPLAKEVTIVNFLESGQLHTETVSYADGSQATFNIGGIHEQADIKELLDVDSTSATKPPRGNLIPASRTGIFEITFSSYQLANHPDADVEWYKGTVRIREAAGAEFKTLQVWKIDVSGPTLKLTVFDPTFDVDNLYAPKPGYNPIQTGSGVFVNLHPSYRAYFRAQAAVLDQATLMPGPGQGAKQTFLAARARNSTLASESNLTTPVVIQANRINPPVAPGLPSGPLYATRPNYFGNATYTIDVEVTADSTREPYAMVFYRANERAVLDTLYKSTTADAVEAQLKVLPAADAAFMPNRWADLVDVRNLHSDYGFHEYTPGGFRFPIPDNANYVIPGTTIKPFNGTTPPGDPGTINVNGVQISMQQIARDAIDGAFLPLTETPVIYQFIKNGTQTSSKKPAIRDRNGDLLPFTSIDFDPSPMVVKYVAAGNATTVRFTDYTLDGASTNIFFYFAREMSDQLRLSLRSQIAGPIYLVNAFRAESPAIRTVTSVLKDAILQVPTGVRLVLNSYIASEGITKFVLFRSTDPVDAASVRTMKHVGEYAALPGIETEIFDDFTDLDFPRFGDPIFYCVVALREIVNERGTTELIPSLPSALARASVIDVENPVAPPLVFNSNPPTMSNPVQLTNVALSWTTVTHNGTYYLYKQDVSGNWVKIHTVKTNTSPVTVPLALTDLATDALVKRDADGREIRHCFKLEVENASGMFSLNESVLSVPATSGECYSSFGTIVSYSDDFQTPVPMSDRICDPAITTFPGTMTFQDMIASLPAGHIFDRIEITVADGLGHAARKIIGTPGGAITFQHTDGTGIVLDGSVTNVRYDVRVNVFTDSCQDGLRFSYSLRFGREIELMSLTSVLSYTDSQSTTSPLTNSFVASGLQFPTTMTFADITALPAGHTFIKMDILVQDDNGASFSKSIGAANGSATFNHGDGGLSLDASAPNRTYQVSARLFTNLSQNGILFNYSISYA